MIKKLSLEVIYNLFSDYVKSISYVIDYKYILAIIKVESSGIPLAIGSTNDYGLMQITKPALTDYNRVHKTKYTLFDIWINPNLNIKVGTWYLTWLFNELSDIKSAIISYNVGIGNYKKGNYSLNYYNKVMSEYLKLERIEQNV